MLLIAIVFFAVLLRLWDLAGPDMLVDDALYAFRSIGYIDYVAALNKQSTPATWFEEPQWWQSFSFHDAPPFVFIIERLFIKIGGDTVWATRLPFVLAGILSIFFTYLIGKRWGGSSFGLISAFLLAFMNYAVWISRIGLLDGFVVLWIAISLYFFVRAQENSIHYIWWGVSCGLGILSKYTFLFMAPVYILFLLIHARPAWRQKNFYIGLALIFILITPIVTYNIMMWKTRGHPDATISTLFGIKPEDFKGLWSREPSTDINIVRTAFGIIHSHLSMGLQIVIAFSVIFLAYATLKNKKDRKIHLILWSGLFFALIILTVIGGSERYGVILLPFFALTIAYSVTRLWAVSPLKIRAGIIGISILIAAWELFFTIQSQLTAKPFIDHPLLISSPYTHPKWAGYNELDAYIEKFYETHPEPSPVITFAEAPQLGNYQLELIKKQYDAYGPQKPLQSNLLVYDDRMDWMGAYWIFERRRLYDVRAIHSISSLLKIIRAHTTKYYMDFGFKNAFFILTTDLTRDNQVEDKDVDKMADEIIAKIKPIEEVRRYDGQVVFRVYQLPLDL